MKRLFFFLIILSSICSSCVKETQYDNNPKGVFDACWNILDQRYCFFSYNNIDWDEVYKKYQKQSDKNINQDSLFTVLNNMMAELKDGHVNLYSSFNVGRYWDWFEDYPQNYFQHITKRYLGNDYKIAGGLKYTILLPDSIGYIYYGSFSNSVSEANLNYALGNLQNCKGIIFDVRNNGGGSLSYSDRIASRFTSEKILSGYIQHKTGKGHDDFSELYPIYLSSGTGVSYYKPTVVLANRSTYSAANNFVSIMKNIPTVKIIGDKSGGGSGLPFSSELPNGWTLRFSASPIYDASKSHTEFGVDPDIKVDISDDDFIKDVDTIIETAKRYINKETQN